MKNNDEENLKDDAIKILNEDSAVKSNNKSSELDNDPHSFQRQNFHKLEDSIFLHNKKLFSRRQIERYWLDLINTERFQNYDKSITGDFLSYWKYVQPSFGRSVSEPHLQTIQIQGTDTLRKWSNSFHELCNLPAGKKFYTNSITKFTPKITTWLYLTKQHCYDLNFAVTYEDLKLIFDEAFGCIMKSSDEKEIMFKLFVDLKMYCNNEYMTNAQMSSLIGNYFFTHSFALSLKELNFKEVYTFFEELMIRHSVLAPPDHINLFSLDESNKILTQFINKYLNCLPLIRYICGKTIILNNKSNGSIKSTN
ncbi:uncharacterized protein LOC126900172 [Daktulosphaira vitifoliae]|uniref:uncharacterized protein LOC126900172 n=1 Tax=Daktulosphaira vitifoliae TaxID=58002 RepID=UPI0021AAF5E1|nr:uncharacterized protein LOC126900172 [Daktulosphaira vitifoliae]